MVREWKGWEEERGHLLWPRQGINKQAARLSAQPVNKQGGWQISLISMDQSQISRWLDRCDVETTHRWCWCDLVANLSDGIHMITFFPLNNSSLTPILLNFKCMWAMAFTFNVIAPTYWISLLKSEDRQQANEVIKLSIDYSLKGGFYLFTLYKCNIRFHSSLMPGSR